MGSMKRIVTVLCAVLAFGSCTCRYPDVIHVNGGRFHVQGIALDKDEVEQVDVCGGWHFKWGSTGLCPLGDGRYYVSENSKTDEGHVCDAVMYMSSDDPESPFVRISE